jgi:DNA polymerase/3'-5' exonuclease PolX
MGSASLASAHGGCTDNEETAQLLDEVAGLFEAQRAKVFRAMAYRRAASAPRALGLPVTEAAAGGSTSLMAALGVGPRLARTIAMILRAASRRW